MHIRTPEDLYLTMLRETHDAEMQLTRALPRMARAASSRELERAFRDHRAQTEDQIIRLEEILERLGEGVGTMRCLGMEGIIAEGEDVMHDDAEPELLDAALIVAAQKVEHYEIAARRWKRRATRMSC